MYAIWVPTHTNWIEGVVGRLLEVLAASTQDELVAAAAPFYARLMSDHRMLSVEPLKTFLRGDLAPMAVLCNAAEAERERSAFEAFFARPVFVESISLAPPSGGVSGRSVELFAGGTASMSTALRDNHGIQVGWTSKSCPDRRDINRRRFPGTNHYGDVLLNEWDAPRDYDVVVVSASFPCTSYSTGGRQLGSAHTDAWRLLSHVLYVLKRLASRQGGRKVRAVLLENVEPFAYLDEGQLLRRLDRDMGALGYCRIVASVCLDGGVEVIDPQLMGYAQPRPSLALSYELREMLTALGPAMPVCMGRRLRQFIRDLLEDFDALDPLLFLKPTSVQVTSLNIRRMGATVYARLGLGGGDSPVTLGSMVRLARPGKFKVLHLQGKSYLDIGDTTDRSNPVYVRVHRDDVLGQETESRNALCIDGQLNTAVTKRGEPPTMPGKAIIADTRTPGGGVTYRPLTTREVYRAQGKPDELLDFIRANLPHLSETQLVGMAGDSLHQLGYADPVAERTYLRLRAYENLDVQSAPATPVHAPIASKLRADASPYEDTRHAGSVRSSILGRREPMTFGFETDEGSRHAPRTHSDGRLHGGDALGTNDQDSGPTPLTSGTSAREPASTRHGARRKKPAEVPPLPAGAPLTDRLRRSNHGGEAYLPARRANGQLLQLTPELKKDGAVAELHMLSFMLLDSGSTLTSGTAASRPLASPTTATSPSDAGRAPLPAPGRARRRACEWTTSSGSWTAATSPHQWTRK